MKYSLKRNIALACTLCSFAACSQGASTSGSGGTSANAAAATSGSATGGDWVANGATACEKYLTPDVVAAILTHPAGKNKTLSAQACSYETTDSGGTIAITLASAGPEAFDQYQKYLVDAVSLPGVGDRASRSMTGIDAVKGDNRMCTIDAGGAPGSTNLRGEALAQKLGEICNKLFALP